MTAMTIVTDRKTAASEAIHVTVGTTTGTKNPASASASRRSEAVRKGREIRGLVVAPRAVLRRACRGRLVGLLFAVVLFIGVSTRASAELIEDITVVSPKALALANAVTADPPGIDSIHFNPAGLIDIPHSISELKVATFRQANHAESGAQRVDEQTRAVYEALSGEPYPQDPMASQRGRTGDVVLLLPGGVSEEMNLPVAMMGGIAIRPPASRVVFATAGYSPMMVGVTRDDDDFGRYQSVETAITRITYLSPSLAWQMNDQWVLGGSLGLSYQGMSLTTDVRAPQAVSAIIPIIGRQLTGEALALGPYDDIARFSVTMEDYVSTNINVGALWEPVPWMRWGIAWRSPTHSRLEGDFSMKYSQDFLQLSQELTRVVPRVGGEAIERGSAELDFNTPAHASLGVSLQMTPDWKLNLDVQKAFYSSWDAFTVHFDQDVDFLVVGSVFDADAQPRSLTLQRRYQDAVSWSIGTEYELTDTLRYRMGYQRRNSVIPDRALDLTMPIADADFYGVGIAAMLEKNEKLEVSAGYLVSHYAIDYGQSGNTNSEDPYDLLYNPYVFLSLKSRTTSALLAFSYVKPF